MTTWVLLRGLTREHAHWGEFPGLLERALPAGGRVLTVDLPGAGVLHTMRCPLDVNAMAGICRRQVLAERGPFALLGLSLGGMVAAAWAAQAPDEVAACVLVNSSLRPFNPLAQRLRLANLPRLLAMLAARDAEGIERRVLELTSTAPSRHADVLAPWVAVRQARPVSRANALRQLLAAARYRHPGHAPGVPTLVVHSAGDALVDPRCSQAIAAHWRVALRTHPSAGHDLPLDDGPWLAAQVAAWAATE